MSSRLGRAIIVWWHDMDRWVVPSAAILSRGVPTGWVRTRVGDVVKLVSNVVKVEPTAEYKMAGVKWYGEGVFHRETVQGDALSARWISPLVPGALIYNRLFAWKASFAVVPANLADCYVSNEFPQFMVDPAKLLPEYLYLWCITDQTIKAVNGASTGSAAVSRNRFREKFFLDFEILLPPLPVQQKIVAAWEAAREAAAGTTAKIERLEHDIEAGFLADLGLKAPAQAVMPKVFAVKWRDLGRWSVMFNQLASVAIDISGGRFPVTILGNVAAVSYGIQKCPANRPDQHPRPYLRVANVQRGELDLRDIKYIDVLDAELPNLGLQTGDILFVEGNGSRAELGRCALWHGEIRDCVHQNHILKVRPDHSKLLPGYAMTWFNTETGRDHFFRSAKTSSGLGTINSSELRAAPIPLPPLAVQSKIGGRVAKQRVKIAKLRAEDKARAEAAKSDVEAMILGVKKVRKP